MRNYISIQKSNITDELLFRYTSLQNCKGYFFNSIESKEEKEIEICLGNERKANYKLYLSLDCNDVESLKEGDLYLFKPQKMLQLLFRIGSRDNVLFLTDQCNNLCLMCSQPPKKKDDLEYFYRLNKSVIRMMPDNVQEIGITGGEPTLQKENLIGLLSDLIDKNSNIYIHILTNGRFFSDFSRLSPFIKFKNNVVYGIPIHSDFYKTHDQVSGKELSYYETLKGIYNLARIKSSIEIRIVIHRLNYKRLFNLSEYIFKNMPFVKHVAFMGMEYFGLAVKNIDRLWIDPYDYKEELERAVLNLSSWKINVSIYNIPLCLLTPNLYEFSQRSISSWKEVYSSECANCKMRQICGGFFGTSIKHSDNIKALMV